MSPENDPDQTPEKKIDAGAENASSDPSSNEPPPTSEKGTGPIVPLDPKVETETPPSSPLAPSKTPPEGAPLPDRSGLAAIIESLLKNPRDIISGMVADPGHRTALRLTATALVCLLGFGFVIGTMSGGHQLWAAPLKVSLGVLVSAVICLPSLYIFACLTGLNLRPGALAGLLAAGVCLAGLLLVGFAPVAWLFGQSTDSTLFYGILCLAFWAIALYFAYGLIRQTVALFSIAKSHHLYIWCGIFALVTIQMSTSLRPIVGTADTFLPDEKKFFIEHWFTQLNDTGKRTTSVANEKVATADPNTKIEAKVRNDGWR